MNTLYNKIKDFCRDNTISIRQFEIDCEIANGIIGKLKDDPEKELSIDTLKAIAKKYPKLGKELGISTFAEPSSDYNKKTRNESELSREESIGIIRVLMEQTARQQREIEYLKSQLPPTSEAG